MINIKNMYKNSYLLHLIVWLLLFTIPYLLSYDNPNVIARMIEHTWLSLILYGIVFYVNYLKLVDQFLFQKKTKSFILINLGLIVLLACLMFYIKGLLHDKIDFNEATELIKDRRNRFSSRKVFVYIDFLTLFIPAVFAYTLKIAERLKEEARKRTETEKVKLESELKYLKNQLQPHFFFNTINNIYSLIDIDPSDAKDSLHRLGKLMRYLLYNTSDNSVLLKDEIDFLTNYIELMKLRVGDNVNVKVDLDLKDALLKIPPMLFLSLVENCFKHGVDAIEPSYISVQLKIQGNKLIFKTINPYFENVMNENSNNKGIGLTNLKQRLSLIFQDNYNLISERRDGVYYTELIILDYVQ